MIRARAFADWVCRIHGAAASLNGPSEGVEDGAGKSASTALGWSATRSPASACCFREFSGDQYNAGRHVPPSQAKRGDLIFYGPGGSQHVTMFLGDGKMLEAYERRGADQGGPVRTAGMTPYVTRIIDLTRLVSVRRPCAPRAGRRTRRSQ